MEQCTLGFGYLLIEERAFSMKELRGCKNAAAIVFRLEKSRTPEEIQQVVQDVQQWFPGEEHLSLRSSLATWMLNVLLPHKFPGMAFPMVGDLTEVQSMLYENIGEWVKGIEDAGIEKGIVRGFKKGFAKGEAQMLASLMARRFGSLPLGVQQEIDRADRKTIRQWASHLLQANSLEQVLNGNGRGESENARKR